MSTILLSEKANPLLVSYLRDKGHDIIYIKATASVHEAIAAHGDIYACLAAGNLVIAPEQLDLIEAQLKSFGICYWRGATVLAPLYPGSIAYNAAITGKYLIHNLKHTDRVLLDFARERGLEMVNVKQGYTKCNCVVVSEDAIITSDQGIASQLSSYPIDVLLVSPGYVSLPGFPQGFLGGASGKVGNSMVFNGNLKQHPDRESIEAFIGARGLSIVYFEDYELEDIGSIIEIDSCS